MKRSLIALMLMMLVESSLLFSQSCPKWGPYAGAKDMGGDAELMMADVMIPQSGMAPFSYTCAIQFKLGSSGGYCGLQDGDGSDSVRPFNNIFSVWDYPNKIQILHTYKDPMTFVGGFGNEGTGLHSHCDFGWKPGQWYTSVVRRWFTGGDKTNVAYFIYVHATKQWCHYVTFAVPEANAMLHGNISSFLENFADDSKRARTSYYKSYWKMLASGTWVKPDSIEGNAGEGNWHCDAYGDDGIALTACGKEMINGKKQTFPVRSAVAKPVVLFPTEIYDLGCYYNRTGRSVVVNWSLKTSGAPQLSYEVQMFASKDKGAKPLATVSGFGPEVREVMLPADHLAIEKTNYYIVLSVHDIFDQAAVVKELTLEELKP